MITRDRRPGLFLFLLHFFLFLQRKRKKVRIYVSGNPVNYRDPGGTNALWHMFGQIVQAVQGGLRWASHGVENAARTANQVANGKHHNENSLSHKLGRSDVGRANSQYINAIREASASAWQNLSVKPANWLKSKAGEGIGKISKELNQSANRDHQLAEQYREGRVMLAACVIGNGDPKLCDLAMIWFYDKYKPNAGTGALPFINNTKPRSPSTPTTDPNYCQKNPDAEPCKETGGTGGLKCGVNPNTGEMECHPTGHGI